MKTLDLETPEGFYPYLIKFEQYVVFKPKELPDEPPPEN